MKKLVIVIILIMFVGMSKMNNLPTTKTNLVIVVNQKEFATEQLFFWFDKFSYNPVIKEMLDSIKSEYPQMIKDINLLRSDSLVGINIDFIGMAHTTPWDDNNPKIVNLVEKSQNSIEKLIVAKKYDLIGSEHFSFPGRINHRIAIDESKYNVHQLVRIINKIDLTLTDEQVNETFLEYAKVDYTYKNLLANFQKPYLIGTEPRWTHLLEQILRDRLATNQNTHELSQNEYSDIVKLIPILSKTRSEIAFAKTARYLLNNGREKKAAIVYGFLHLKDFEIIQEKCKTKGQLINLSYN